MPWLLLAALVALEFIEVHGPDGQLAYVNTHEISSLRSPVHSDLNRSFPRGVHCIIITTNGKFVAARETCDELRQKLEK